MSVVRDVKIKSFALTPRREAAGQLTDTFGRFYLYTSEPKPVTLSK
jgi:hypothetical protein